MIYTSYFAKLKSLPDNIIPIAICAKAPGWYKGLQYKKLAPKYDFFMEWNRTHDNDYYIKCFKEIETRNCNNCPYKYIMQHTYKHGMVGEITMCKLYDKQLYYYGNDTPKPDHEHNCFEEVELKRVDRLDLVKIDIDKLRDNIDKFEHYTNKRAYLFLSCNTMGCLEAVYPSIICYSVVNSKTGIVGEFDCRKIFIDNNIEFGKVEIR